MCQIFVGLLEYLRTSKKHEINWPLCSSNYWQGKDEKKTLQELQLNSLLMYCKVASSSLSWLVTSHSAYVATETESDGAKIDGLLPPNLL